MKKKEHDLLQLLMNNSILSLEKISFFLNESSVAARKNLEELNTFLNKTNLGIIRKEKQGYRLELFSKYKFKNVEKDIKDFEPEERINYFICLLIFEEKVTLISLEKIFGIGWTTLMRDVYKTRLFLKKFNLGIKKLPWKGVELEGTPEDVKSFSIQFLLKILLKQEINIFSWQLYGLYVNPLIKQYLDEKLVNFEFKKIEKIIEKIIEKMEIHPEIYIYTTLKSIFIYSYLKKEKVVSYHFKELKLQKKYEEIHLKLLEISELSQNKEYKKSIVILAVAIANFSKEALELLKKNTIVLIVLDNFKKKYGIVLNNNEKYILINLIHTLQFKCKFSIRNYIYCHITENDIPENILINLRDLFKRNKVGFFEEDISLLALFLYQTINRKYMEGIKNKKILLCDSSYKNWIAEGLSKDIKKNIPNLEIKIISIWGFNMELEKIFKRYDYIVFINCCNKNFFIKNDSSEEKIIFFDYKSHFEINNFLGQLFIKNKNY